MTDDRVLYDAVAAAIVLVAMGWGTYGLCTLLERGRPGLSLVPALAFGIFLRLGCVGLFAGIASLGHVRGPDELGFLAQAHRLTSDLGALGPFPDGLSGDLNIWLLATALKLFGGGVGDIPLRFMQVGIAIAGIALIAAAVNDVSGPRAGALAAWLLAVEPTGVFFSGILHKESAMLLGEGLLVLGAVRMYQLRDIRAGALLLGGVGIAALIRPYAGGMLALAAGAVTCHAALRHIGPERRRMPALAGSVVVVLLLLAVVGPSPQTALDRLQRSQDANTRDASSLKLEPVDFSSPGGVVTNLPRRVSDLLTRPYPWQLSNTSQQLGVIGTLTAWLLLALVVVLVARRPRDALRRLAPLLYVLVAAVVAYALSTGNAGTGFRYRTHILALLIAVSCALLPDRVFELGRARNRLRLRVPDIR